MLVCGLTLGFFRLYLGLFFGVVYWFGLQLLSIGQSRDKPLSTCRRKGVCYLTWFIAKTELFLFGYMWNKHTKLKFKDYDDDYPE